jgi:tetratricopeptide (TPR) repeat protein
MGINASREGLEKIETARLKKGWGPQEQAWYNLALTSLSVLKRFRSGTRIELPNFIALCQVVGIEDWQSIADFSFSEAPKRLVFTPHKYDPKTWVGREKLIEDLLTKLKEKTRIVWLTGFSGIGKTTLGECIAVKAWENNPSFQYVKIPDFQSSNFVTGAREILSELGEKNFNLEEMNDEKWLSNHLLTKLQSNSYWLQIDSIENLIESNEFIENYWFNFFNKCLTVNNFASRLLLTSQVLPLSMIDWQYEYSNIWHQQKLSGLNEEESKKYFAKNGIVINESNQNILTRIASTYEGHPFVLQVITREILQVYQGNVTTYWKVNQAEFEQVSRELNSSRLTEIDYNEQLTRRVRERVKKSLEQLPEKAIALLCRSAVYRRSVPQSFWLGLITEYSTKEQLEAYRVLGDRSLIEKEKNLIRLHNLVRDISYDWLREDEIIWKAAEVKAAELWLSKYQPEESAENLEKVRGYLEAFYHYCDAEDWAKAGKLFMQINSDNHQLYFPLCIGSYYQEQINLSQRLLGKLIYDYDYDIACLMSIGRASFALGKRDKALEAYKNAENILISLDYRSKIDEGNLAAIYNQIGIVYRNKGYKEAFKEAFQYFQKALNKIENKKTTIPILNNLGLVSIDLEEEERAYEYLHQALKACETFDNDNDELYLLIQKSDTNGNLGTLYMKRKEYPKAIFYLEKQLKISYEISQKNFSEYRDGIMTSLLNLGLSYINLGIESNNNTSKINQGINYLQESLEIAKDIGALYKKAQILFNLGYAKTNLEQYDNSLQNLQEALEIFQKIKSRKDQVIVLDYIAKNYYKKRQIKLARQHCEQALQIATELGIPLAQECQELLSKIEEEENC